MLLQVNIIISAICAAEERYARIENLELCIQNIKLCWPTGLQVSSLNVLYPLQGTLNILFRVVNDRNTKWHKHGLPQIGLNC